MRLERFNDWPERYVAFVEARRNMPFAWGSNDCASWGDMILELTDVDVLKDWRAYKTERAATRLLHKAGGMRGLLIDVGLTEKHKGLASRTDVVIANGDGRETFGIVDVGCWWGPGPEGAVFRPMNDVVAVFEF